MGEARRYNKGKLRYELLPEKALKDIVEVYTKGAEKYTIYNEDGSIKDDGANNWRKGLPWMSMIGSIERHIKAFKQGEDIDPDLGTKHLANAAWGLMGILEYYKIAPQFDDRPHTYLSDKKIGLDIDEVLCNWLGAWRTLYKIDKEPTSWFFDRQIVERFDAMKEAGTLDPFYANLEPLLTPEDIPFEPHCYITSRPCKLETTVAWLDKHNFPTKPVYCVGSGKSKVEVAKESGIDIFVDDAFPNFQALNKAGICTYLYDRPHNKRYDVGHKRIFSLKDLI